MDHRKLGARPKARPSPDSGAGPGTAARPRQGPRPLPLHLTTATGAWSSSKLALALLRSGSNGWLPALRPEVSRLRESLGQVDPDALSAALDREAERRLDQLTAGIAGYRRHPYRRRLAAPACVAELGSTRLLHYPAVKPASGAPGAGRPVLLVPSLINRAYILDLAPRRSFARWLARRGFETFLVDWGWPGETERSFTLTDYITGRLEPLLDRVSVQPDPSRRTVPPIVVGYCMGGLLALALALRRQEQMAGLALLATPWDFHAGEEATAGDRSPCPWAPQMAPLAALLEPVLSGLGVLPVDLIQALFASRDPLGAARKFRAFAGLDPQGTRARAFVALEDWLNDGVPLAAAVARECLVGWYGHNLPARLQWRVAGAAVDPTALRCPALCLIPAQDRIVPPGSAAALAAAIPGSARMAPPVGHVGMMASRGAASAVWQPLVDWIVARR